MKKYNFYLILLLCIRLYSQNDTFAFSHLSVFDGLSQGIITVIRQDHLGQMWIGTRDGLNKYDGTKITIYRREANNANSLSNDHILAIEEDSEGYLWIGTHNGLNRYDPKTDTFTRYTNSLEANTLKNATIWCIYERPNGKIWMGTDNGIAIFDKENNTFSTYLYDDVFHRGLRINSILETDKGELFLGSIAGLIRIKEDKRAGYLFEYLEGCQNIFIEHIIEGKANNLLIATRHHSVKSYNLTTGTFRSYFDGMKFKEENKSYRKLLFDEQGRLWIGANKGLFIVDKNKNVIHLKENSFDKKGLSTNSIKSLFRDRDGAIWIGTFYGGVNIWDKTNNNFKHIPENKEGFGLNSSVVSSFAKCGNNIVYGTEGGGINLYNLKTNTYKYVTTSNSNIKSNTIKSLLYTKDSILWAGTLKEGIDFYDVKKGKLLKNYISKDLDDILKGESVYALEDDDKGNVYIGTFGRGLFKYNIDTKEILSSTSLENSNNKLSSQIIRSILVDYKGNIWAGTEKGLNKITPDGHIRNYFYNASQKHGERVLNMYEDNDKQLWISIKSEGLYKFDGKVFTHITLLPEEPYEPSIHSILKDEEGNLWLSTNRGVIRYNEYTESKTLYAKAEKGFITNAFNNNAGILIGHSAFYFGGADGVTYFNSDEISTKGKSAKVILTNFSIRGNKTNKDDCLRIAGTTTLYTKSVDLDYNQGNFNISFSVPNFINANDNKYRYRLQNVEKEWNISKTGLASYTIQNAGNYIFEVTAANPDGSWNDTITQLQINVAPAPWLTWWAFLIYGIIVGAVFYFYVRILKSKEQLKHTLSLEQVEAERSKELNQTKLQFFTNISHEFRTPLSLILGPLQQIIENYQGSSTVYKQLKVIENNASRLLELINRLMDFRKLENKIFNLEATNDNIVKFLNEIYLSFLEYAKVEGYAFEFKSSDNEIMLYFDRKKLERLVYNLLSNAFKYTPKGNKIELQVVRDDKHVIIKVKDTGIGIEHINLNKVFDRFFEVKPSHRPNDDFRKGTGIGLAIAKDIVSLHKGEIKVESEGINKGATFIVKLPLGKAHLEHTIKNENSAFSEDISQYLVQVQHVNTDEEHIREVTEDSDRATILIVEDNKQLRHFIKTLLSSTYKVLEAEDGAVAFNMAKKKAPDLIISDVVMPNMTGTALCTALKNEIRTSHIPIILLTSRTALIYKLEGLEQGADDYISKPFNVNELKLRVSNLLKSREKLREKFKDQDSFDDSATLTSSHDEELYKKAIKLVKENIGNDAFDIAFFASELGVSRTMLFTKIKAWSNYTPNEFINHFKMKLAAQLLEQGHLNISQISYRVGFKTTKHFRKCFNKKYGQNPSEYACRFTSA